MHFLYFYKHVLNDIFVLLRCSCNCSWAHFFCGMCAFKLWNIVVNVVYIEQSLSAFFENDFKWQILFVMMIVLCRFLNAFLLSECFLNDKYCVIMSII